MAGGGDTQSPGDGFSAGVPERCFYDEGGVNGCVPTQAMNSYCPAGAYYDTYASCTNATSVQLNLYDYTCPSSKINEMSNTSGGIGGGTRISTWGCSGEGLEVVKELFSKMTASKDYTPIGELAKGGKGGNVVVSENVSLNSYNGSYITTKDSSSMTNQERIDTQALIYAQAGYDVKAIRELQIVKVVNSRTINNLVDEWSQADYDFTAQRTIKIPYDSTCGSLANSYVLGIGSGAGGSQVTNGNGTYTIDSSLN